MKSGFDSSGVSRDTSRVEMGGLEISESGQNRLQRITYSLDRFQFYLPVYRNQFINSTLGNNGTAIQDLNFQPRFNGGFNWGFGTFLPYVFDLKDMRFYDAQSPYTEASYTQGGKQEAFFKIRHTQNVGKALNFGLDFQRVNSAGTYLRQTAAHSALRFHAWYRPGKGRYQAFAGIVYHKGASFENGGITAEGDSTFQTNTVNNRQLYPINLLKARNKVFRNGFLLRQTYDLFRPNVDSNKVEKKGASLRIQHTLQYNFNRHSYDDENPVNTYYTSIADSGRKFLDYYNSQWESEAALLKLSNVSDTAHQMHWEAKAFLKQQSAHVWMNDSIQGQSYNLHVLNQSLGGKLDYTFRPQLKIHAETELFYSGYNSGDLQLAGNILLKPKSTFVIQAGIESYRQEPVYQLQRFISNFGTWSNSFKKINLLKVYGTIQLPKLHTEIKVSNQLIGNWVYMSQNAAPAQFSSAINVLSAQVENQIHLRKWHLYSRILYQKVSGTNVIRLPEFQYQESVFREGRIGKSTPWRIGIDVIGCSLFRANAYQPQSGLFYLQYDKLNKGLIQANFYVSVKIRRARIFAMMEHVNAGIAGMQANVIPYYPLPDRLLKIGFNWVFFD